MVMQGRTFEGELRIEQYQYRTQFFSPRLHSL